ncbi:phospholipase [Marinomonas agarivorans]|nr:phospholipase [Marinomonas agarivorans]
MFFTNDQKADFRLSLIRPTMNLSLFGIIFLLCSSLLHATTPSNLISEGGFLDDSVLDGNVPESKTSDNKIITSRIAQRLAQENSNLANAFALTPHKPNYFFPFHYQTDINDDNFLPENATADKVEFVFQFSAKVTLVDGLFGEHTRLWAAYTQKSLWQSYNTDNSSPFRETNYEPEVFLGIDLSDSDNPLKPDYLTLGFNHQSNGRGGDTSRSWNRLFAELFYESGNTVMIVKPWYRLPEDDELDNNPNIERYYGYAELQFLHTLNQYQIEFMLRNNLRAGNRAKNKGAVQVGVSFPLIGKSRGYIQYFNGYGQSLIEYDERIQSLSAGIQLTSWL